ncbi:MAG: hypothetical protein ACM3KM_01800 [Acidobacteriaceae bacterium]
MERKRAKVCLRTTRKAVSLVAKKGLSETNVHSTLLLKAGPINITGRFLGRRKGWKGRKGEMGVMGEMGEMGVKRK